MSETEDTQPLQPDEDARPNAPGPGGAGKLEAGRDHVTDESIDVGSSAWRGQVLRQAYRLEEELDRLPVDGLDGPGRAIVASVRTRVAQAKWSWSLVRG